MKIVLEAGISGWAKAQLQTFLSQSLEEEMRGNTKEKIQNTKDKIDMRLSQGQLNMLDTCPRKLQLTDIDRLGVPGSPEQQEQLVWGTRFHLIMQQRELGLPIESLVGEDPQLQSCFAALQGAAPEIFAAAGAGENPGFREAEHERILHFNGYLLTVRYDLLIADAKHAQILDWKTYPRPQNRQKLAANWQTRLYLYVLAETSDYLPKQISMTYWFVQSAGEGVPVPQSLKFAYNATQHKKTLADLTRLLSNFTGWQQRYQEAGEPFPQVREEAGQCRFCPFAVRCGRTQNHRQDALAVDRLPSFASIEEVAL